MASLNAIIKKLRERGAYVPPPLGTREILCEWVREEEPHTAPMIELQKYAKLLELLPDHIVQNLERARLSRDGRVPMIKAGLGYEELLSSVIVDGTAITSSSTETFLFPALLFGFNYLQPGGLAGRTIHWKARGRVTTLATAATMTIKFGSAVTNVIPTATWAVSGAMPCDATAQTNTQWLSEGMAVVRSVGSAGTVFGQGDCQFPPLGISGVVSPATFALAMMGSAGSTAPATATVDLTVPQYVSLTGKWSLTTAYSIQGHIFIVESLN